MLPLYVILPLSRSLFKSQLCRFHKGFLSNMPIKVGDSLPSVELSENTPDNKVNIADLFKGKKGIIFGVPGAFTPTCSKTHLPSYLANYDKLKAKGVDLIVCVSVNDPFVMDAWGKEHNAAGKIRMLADTCADFAKAIDITLDLTKILGNTRSGRYSMVVQDGKVKTLHIEPEPGKVACSLAADILKDL